MKTEKTITGDVDPDVLDYTVGDDPVLDMDLVRWDCLGTAAHVTMLSEMPVTPPVVTQEEAARKVGKTQSAVANKLRLLRLSQQNMELIRCNNLTERHARALLRLNDEADRINVTNYIIEHELNVSRTEEYIDEFLKAKENPQPVVEPESGKHVVRLFKDVRFFLNTLNRAVGVMVDAGIGATVKQQESDDGLTLTICIPHAKG